MRRHAPMLAAVFLGARGVQPPRPHPHAAAAHQRGRRNQGDQQSSDVGIGNANSGTFCSDVSSSWYQPQPKLIAYNTWTNIIMTSSASNGINIYIDGLLYGPSIGSNVGYYPSASNIGSSLFAFGWASSFLMSAGFGGTVTTGAVVLGSVQSYPVAVNVGNFRSGSGDCAYYYFDCSGVRIPSSTSTQLSNEMYYNYMCYTSLSAYQFSCNSGYYFALDTSSNAWRCTACTTSCGSGQYQSQACSGASNTQCANCDGVSTYCPDTIVSKVCVACSNGYYLSSQCSTTANGKCSQCTPAGRGGRRGSGSFLQRFSSPRHNPFPAAEAPGLGRVGTTPQRSAAAGLARRRSDQGCVKPARASESVAASAAGLGSSAEEAALG